MLAREVGTASLRAHPGSDGAVFKSELCGQHEGATVLRNVTSDPLDWDVHRALISDDQHSAGRVTQDAFYAAFGSGMASVQYDGVHGVTSHAGFAPSQQRWDQTLVYIEVLNRVRFMARGIVVAVVSFG